MVLSKHLVLRIFELTKVNPSPKVLLSAGILSGISQIIGSQAFKAQAMLLYLIFKVLNLCLETKNITGDYGSAWSLNIGLTEFIHRNIVSHTSVGPIDLENPRSLKCLDWMII